MSKHHNYNNYSKMTMPEVVAEVEASLGLVETEEAKELTEEIMAQPALTIEEIAEQMIDEELPIKPEPKTGIVTADRLNIRKLPVAGAQVITIVNKDTKLMIDPDYETVEWIKVYTEAGIEGYCMKKFVTFK